MKSHKSSGFTLIEISIVLLIVTIILGYTVAMFPVQQELKQYRQADAEMDRIIEALYAYAQVNGRLPCADSIAAPDGRADPDDGTDCTANGWYGFLPGKTLGIDGRYDANLLLIDPWGNPYRYEVTRSDSGGTVGGGDFVVTNDMRNVGIASLNPDLQVCTVNPTVNLPDTDCGIADVTVAENIPAVVFSLGKDGGNVASNMQDENLDNNNPGFASPDTVFVKSTRNDAAGTEFDDLVKWISPNILYSRMIEAGQLP